MKREDEGKEVTVRIIKGKETKYELGCLQNSGHPEATISELIGQCSGSCFSSQQDAQKECNYS